MDEGPTWLVLDCLRAVMQCDGGLPNVARMAHWTITKMLWLVTHALAGSPHFGSVTVRARRFASRRFASPRKRHTPEICPHPHRRHTPTIRLPTNVTLRPLQDFSCGLRETHYGTIEMQLWLRLTVWTNFDSAIADAKYFFSTRLWPLASSVAPQLRVVRP